MKQLSKLIKTVLRSYAPIRVVSSCTSGKSRRRVCREIKPELTNLLLKQQHQLSAMFLLPVFWTVASRPTVESHR